MDSSACIEQQGVIKKIENGIASVSITTFTACSTCSSKSGCSMMAGTDKEIQVVLDNKGNFHTGETVSVGMKKTLGMKAAILAYILPFVIVIFTLLLLTMLKFSEVIAGSGALFILLPYFILLYILRDKLQKTFSFTLRKVF